MTRTTLRIDRLLYLGPDKKTVDVELKPGLNILCGASESGKSFVVETIDFMLGGAGDLRDLPERAGYDRVVMQISLSDGKTFTIQRTLHALAGVDDSALVAVRQAKESQASSLSD
jgi:DNA repair ATPase RecN